MIKLLCIYLALYLCLAIKLAVCASASGNSVTWLLFIMICILLNRGEADWFYGLWELSNLWFVKSHNFDNSPDEECKIYPLQKKHMLAYRGWPFKLLCSTFLDLKYDSEERVVIPTISSLFKKISKRKDLEETIIKCEIMNSTGGTVFKETMKVKEAIYQDLGHITNVLNNNSSLKYTTIITAERGFCVSMNYNLHLVDTPDQRCPVVMNDSSYLQRSSFGMHLTRSCNDGLNHFPKLARIPGATYQWHYNCSTNSPTNTILENQIVIKSLRFNHAGIYTCKATYNDLSTIIDVVNLCVEYKPSIGTVLLDCENLELFTNVGDTVDQICTANYGKGNLKDSELNIQLSKLNSNKRVIRCESLDTFLNKRRDSCTLEVLNNQCYNYPPKGEQLLIPDAVVRIRITLRILNKADYGEYLVQIKIPISKSQTTITLFKVAPDPTSILISQASVAGICIGIMLLLLIMLVVLLYNSLYVRVYYKRYFGNYVIDDKQYGAYLAYNFSHHSTDKFTKDLVRDWIPRIRDSLEELGYLVYDEHKDGWMSSERIESMLMGINNSHRVIILLNENFLKDDWNKAIIQQGFDQMIRTGSKLIFLLPPGIKEYLNQLLNSRGLCKLTQSALKLNYAIQLPLPYNKNFVKMSLEYAMPKLCNDKKKKHLYFRSESCSSLSLNDFHSVVSTSVTDTD